MTISLERPPREDLQTPDRPIVPVPLPEQERIRLGNLTSSGTWSLVGAFLAAISLTWVVFERILPLSGAAGFWICVALVTAALYGLVVWAQTSNRLAVDKVMRLPLTGGGLIVLAVVLDLVGYTIFRGYSALSHGNFWTQSMENTGTVDPLTSGGMIHALIGSLEQMGIATVLSVPLGIAAALYLVEMGGPLARVVRIITEAMTALPEIVAGLFIYALYVLTLGLPRSGLAAALALTVMMVPVVTRTSEVVLRLVPGTLREASYALGAGQRRTILNVVLPTARSGLATGVILAMARAVGETSPVLLTAGFTTGVNVDPLHNAQVSLPLYVFIYEQFPTDEFKARAFGAALALMIMVLILFFLARLVGGKAPGELTRRQRRRIARERRGPADDDGFPAPAPHGPNADDVPVITAPGFPDPVVE